MTQRSESNNPDFSDVKRGLVEFIEQLDRLALTADNYSGDRSAFAEAVAAVARQVLSVPEIARLRGRVREASYEEVRDALVMLAKISEANGQLWPAQMLADSGSAPSDVLESLRRSRDAFRRTGIHRN